MDINSRVRELRLALGLSMAAFGLRLGMTRQAVSRIESGRVAVTLRTQRIIILTDWDGRTVNPDWLSSGSGSMFGTPPRP